MGVTATYNTQSFDLYLKSVFAKYPHLESQLLADFIAYKSTGNLPDYFGRDTLYSDPEDIRDAELRHIHFELGKQVFGPLPKWIDLSDKQAVQWERTTNTALVYARHLLDENHYTLMAVFTPYAHEYAREEWRMRELAGYARKFSQF